MKRPLKKILEDEGFVDLGFCVIWACMFVVSILFAIDAYHLSLIKLGTFEFRIPEAYNLSMNGLKFQDVINGIADTQDKNANALQAAIKDSSNTLRNLNAIASLLSAIGFLLQFRLYRQKKRDAKTAYGEIDNEAPMPEIKIENGE